MMSQMPAKKASGAKFRTEGLKRKLKEDHEAKKSSKIMKNFLLKATDNEEISKLDTKTDVIACNTSVCNATEEMNQDQSDQDKTKELKKIENLVDNTTSTTETITSHSEGSIQKEESTLLVIKNNDIGYLNFDETTDTPKITHALRTELVSRGSNEFQNKSGPFSMLKGRSMTKKWFVRQLANGQGQEICRTWLLYSPLKKAAYCFCCLLFPSSTIKTGSSFELATGFNNWRKPERLLAHESSPNHRKSFSSWKEAERAITQKVGIDAELEAQIQTEKQNWRNITERVLSCIKYLVTQNLALRGHREKLSLDDNTNPGNFIAVLKLLAKYDPLLSKHLKQAKDNPRSVSYLSPQIQNEFIQLLASAVKKKLISDIKKNCYYGILFDSTPDLAHREQFSQVIRFVDIDYVNKTVLIKETFLGFIELHAKDAASITDVILKKLNADNLSLENCRSQCYDNAAVMSGSISGVQQRINKLNHRILFVNCDNHTLNLAGLHSAKEDSIMVTFFGAIECIYLFFCRSTLRWEQLNKTLKNNVKRESETRWSARSDAVNAIFEGLDNLVKLLEGMSDDKSSTYETRSEAENLLQSILQFNFITLLYFWQPVLQKINRVQKRLQDPKMNFYDASCDLEALASQLNKEKEDICQCSIKNSKKKCEKWGIKIEKRIRRRRQMPGELARDAGLSAELEILRIMKSALDRFQNELTKRFSNLKNLNVKFGLFLNVHSLMNTRNLESIQTHCKTFSSFYNTDVNEKELYNEIVDCQMLLQSRSEMMLQTPLELLSFIVHYGEDVFPNLRVTLQILLTVAVSIASCERSFSKLKLIESHLRTTMGEERLSNLSLLSIERETLETIDFNDVINEFAAAKARKICFI